MIPNFATEKPYVLSTRAHARRGDFYTLDKALEEVKLQRGTRLLYGMHRGDWKLLGTFVNGVRQPPT